MPIASQTTFNAGIVLIASPRRVWPYNLQSRPYVSETKVSIRQKRRSKTKRGGRGAKNNLLDVDNLQVLLDFLRHVLDIFPVVRRQ